VKHEANLGLAPKCRFHHQNLTLEYFLQREKCESLQATVLPSRTLVLKVPIEATEKRIEEFLKRKARWILKQQRFFGQFKAQASKSYVSGETFRYRGRSYKLLIKKTNENDSISLQPGILSLRSTAPKERRHNEALLREWYRERARMIFSERLSICFTNFQANKPAPDLFVRQMSRRWGSYSPKSHRISLNQDLIQATTPQIDYVLTHELCHMTHEKHNKAFYRLLEAKLPQWKKLKAGLELGILG